RINLGSQNKITVYADSPNAVLDLNTSNDTLDAFPLYAPLNGTYTIGHSGADFESFNEAIATIKYSGISGPVIFNVKSGIYNEQMLIPSIIGTSATNTIAFQSAAGHVDSVILNHYAGTDSAVVKLVNASYIHFKHLTVKVLNS